MTLPPTTTTGAIRKKTADDIREAEVKTEETFAKNQNHMLYEYKPSNDWVAYSKVNPMRRYTHGTLVVPGGGTDDDSDTVGGDERTVVRRQTH